MTSGQLVTIIVALIGGTGLWETLRRAIDARSKRQTMRERQPEAMQDSSVLRAQQALLVMEGSLKAAERRAEAAETRVAELEAHIDRLELEIDAIRTRLNDATVQLNQANQQLQTLEQLRAQLPPAQH